jgi:predicted ribosome quality control (RQC) complex YloA/Tae2 family protein
MQTALHIYALVKELNDSIIGSVFIGTEFYKKEREAYTFFKINKKTHALGLAYHPVGYGSFLIPRGKINITSTEKPWPFFQQAEASIVKKVSQIGFDRIIKIELEKDSDKFAVIVEAIGPNGNFWLLNEADLIIATLRNKKYDSDRPYSPPAPLDRINPLDINAKILRQKLNDIGGQTAMAIKNSVAGLNDILAGEICYRGGIDPDLPVTDLNNDQLDKLNDGVQDLVKRFKDYQKGYLYDSPSTVVPFRGKSFSGEAEKFKSLSLAVYVAVRERKSARVEISGRQKTVEAVKRHIKKLKKKQSNIEKDILIAERADLYRKYAEHIKANLTTIKKGTKKLSLDDLYVEGEKITIQLDPSLSPNENAERYFKKFRKVKDSLALLKRRLVVVGKETDSAEKMKTELETDFDSAGEKYRAEIAAILPGVATRRAEAPRLPYRPFTLSTGVTIFVGKDGSDNDKTTFHHARNYELWFHASQCPGSHVVMKYPDKKFVPSKNEIAETAAIAAYYSKARRSAAVPVSYTERKYVRKPRGAKPGLVTIEREKTIMVEPKKPG